MAPSRGFAPGGRRRLRAGSGPAGGWTVAATSPNGLDRFEGAAVISRGEITFFRHSPSLPRRPLPKAHRFSGFYEEEPPLR